MEARVRPGKENKSCIELVGGPKNTWVYDPDNIKTGPAIPLVEALLKDHLYEDTGLISFLGNKLYKYVGEPHNCPICTGYIEPYEGMRTDSTGNKYWCKSCTDEHDAIDWEEVAEKRMGM